METVADNNLLELWVTKRDADAFNALTRRYSGLVFTAALRILGNTSDAEDVAQSCFETLAIASNPPTGALAPWLHRVATNRALDSLRTARNRSLRERVFAERQETHVEIAWDDIYAHVDAVINELPDELRIVLLERFYSSRPADEIAQDLGINRRTVYHRSERGIEEVRNLLRKRGIAVANVTLAILIEENLSAAAALPASLSATLGQLAMAGIRPTNVTGPLAIAAGSGGTLAFEKALTGIIVVIIVAFGFWRFSNLVPPLPEASLVRTTESSPPDTATDAQAPADNVAVDAFPTAFPTGAPPESQKFTDAQAALNPTGRIDGQVVDIQGVGVSGAHLFWGIRSNLERPTQWLCQTDSEGRFTADNIPERAATLIAYHPDHKMEEQPIAPVMKFVLGTGCVLKGRVTDTSKPIQYAHVTLTRQGKRVASFYSITNPEGEYLLKKIPAGTYILNVILDSTKFEKTVVLEARETSIVDIELALSGVTVQGIISGAESPEQICVSLDVATASGLQQYNCQGNSDGTYRMDNIPPGTAQLKVEARRVGAIDQQRIFYIEIPAGEKLTHDVHFSTGGSVSGVVSGLSASRLGSVAALSGNLDLSSIVSVVDVQTTMLQADFLTVANVGCNPAGEFLIDGLQPGPYTLIAVSSAANAELEVEQWEWSVAVVQIDEDGQSIVQDFSF